MKVPAIYINLGRVPERSAHMQTQLRAAGLERAERHPATDAAAGGIDAPGYRPRAWKAYWTLKPSEVACFESHLAVWTRVAEGQAPAAAVFEDDIFASPDLGLVIDGLAAHSERFDVVKLDGAPGKVRLGPEVRWGEHDLRPIRQVLVSAAAYILSREGAKKLVLRAATYCDHVDDFLMAPYRNWRPYQLLPARAVQGVLAAPMEGREMPGSVSVSERTGDPGLNAGYEKGPVPYRLAKEMRRAARRAHRLLRADRRLIQSGGMIGEVPLAPGLGDYRRG